MAIEIRIKQKGLFKKAINLAVIESLFDNPVLLGCRDLNSAYVLEELRDSQIEEINIVAVNPKQIGRGFILSKDAKDLKVSLNVPATEQDITDFFHCIESACKLFKVHTFILDDEKEIELAGLNELKQDIQAWNNNYLLEQVAQLQQKQMTFVVFGGYNPIYISSATLDHWVKLPVEELTDTFKQFLHQKQSEDLYYMKPMFYQNQQGEILGAYSLTLGVSSIVPKQAFVPVITSGLPDGIKPTHWQLALVMLSEKQEPTIKYIDYDSFVKVINQMNLEHYDENHYILREPNQLLFDQLLK
ncbi:MULTISPECIES: DUF4299 family protein [Myroides]|nr:MULTISPECIES: DUF4299 family protein [Myroides]UVD79085.1 DUF4299 domain-containing protein [Myroides albus]